jgi:methionine biosynthesis protein MetW
MTSVEEVIYEKIWDRTLLEESKFYFSRTEEAINLLDEGNKILDVGCGEGTFATSARKNFDYVCGIDLSLKALQKAKDKKLEVIKVNLNREHFCFKNETFDAAVCLDVVEHVFDPVALLSEINRVLKKDGVLILTTPNVRFIEYVSSMLLKGKFSSTSDDKDTYNGGHLNYFTFRDLRALLNQSGFRVLHEKGIALRSYKSFKTILFRRLIRLWEREVEKEFFCKGIIVKATKIG